jgi:hypothetical protein
MFSTDKEFCYGDGIFRKYDKVSGNFTIEKCHICTIAASGNFTKYAHLRAKNDAHKIAHGTAEEKANKLKINRYLDYFMYIYRIEFLKIYNDCFINYRVEYLRSLFKNVDLEICDWHKRDRNALKECKHIFEPDRCNNCSFMKDEFYSNANTNHFST